MPDKAALISRLERLVAGGNALMGEPHLAAVLQRIADLARSVIETRYAAVGLLAPDRRSLEVFVTSGLTPEEVERIGPPPRGLGLLGTIIRSQHPLRLERITDHADSIGFPPNHPRMEAFIGVPMVGQHGVLGNLYLTDRVDGRPFGNEDEHLLLLLASMAARSVENARLHEDTGRLVADVQALLRSRERFFAMVNHELRNAIAAVYGWAEMLTRRKEPSDVPKAAFEVLESAESAVALINDLLDLSRLDEDRLRPVPQDLDLVPVLRRAIAKQTPSARAREVRVELEAPAEGVPCRTDAHRVEQIMVNLLSNAVRHTEERSRVLVRCDHAGDAVEVAVLDEGPGVPEDRLDRIFDVYHTGSDGEGVGLGLPLSRRLARLLHGELRAGNRPPPERGASFTLHLPCRPDHDAVS